MRRRRARFRRFLRHTGSPCVVGGKPNVRRIALLAAAAALVGGVVPTVLADAAAAAVDGTFSVLAGGAVGDGQPATSIYLPANPAVREPDGNLLLADNLHGRVREVDVTTGLVSTVAGIGEATLIGKGHDGDGGPATAATLSGINAVAVSATGDIYIADANGGLVRRIDHATRVITHVAGTGPSGMPVNTADARTSPMQVMGMAIDNTTGDVYLGDWHDVVSVLHPDGSLERFAGSGTRGNTGDGGPATTAALLNPYSVAVLPDGSVAIDSSYAIRLVDTTTGLISTIAGGGTSGDLLDGNSPTSGSIQFGGVHIAAGPDSASPGGSIIYFVDGNRVRSFALHADRTEGPVATLALTTPRSCNPSSADATTLVATCGTATYLVDLATAAATRVAGIDPTYPGGDRALDGTPGADAPIGSFSAIAASGDDVYLSSGVGLIYRISSDGVVHRFAGVDAARPQAFPADDTPLLAANLSPQAMAPAPGGGLFFVDCIPAAGVQCAIFRAHDGVLDRYTSLTAAAFTEGMPVAQFALPGTVRLATMPDGDLAVAPPLGPIYVVRAADGTVHKVPFDPSTVLSQPGYHAPAPVFSGLAAFGDGTLAASVGSNSTDGRLVQIDPSTGAATTLAAANVSTLAPLPDGDVVAVSTSRLLRISPQGGVTVLADGGTSHSGGSLTDMQTRLPSTPAFA